MEKSHSLILSSLITLLFVSNFILIKAISSSSKESVFVSRVIDGDTIELEDKRIVRLLNVNSPEKGLIESKLSLDYLEKIESKNVTIQFAGSEIYGRGLGRVYMNGEYINLGLVEQGLAHHYLVSDKEMFKFRRAQDRAFEDEIGIWKRSKYYGCIEAEIYKEEEYLIITNLCDLDMKGLSLKDESTKRFSFDIKGNSSKRIFSGTGNDTDALYLKSTNIWNNDRDSIFIRDNSGLLVYYSSYGY